MLKQLPTHAELGGYALVYLNSSDQVLCPSCATQESLEDEVKGRVHWEGHALDCELCNAEIESAYGNPEEDDE